MAIHTVIVGCLPSIGLVYNEIRTNFVQRYLSDPTRVWYTATTGKRR